MVLSQQVSQLLQLQLMTQRHRLANPPSSASSKQAAAQWLMAAASRQLRLVLREQRIRRSASPRWTASTEGLQGQRWAKALVGLPRPLRNSARVPRQPKLLAPPPHWTGAPAATASELLPLHWCHDDRACCQSSVSHRGLHTCHHSRWSHAMLFAGGLISIMLSGCRSGVQQRKGKQPIVFVAKG